MSVNLSRRLSSPVIRCELSRRLIGTTTRLAQTQQQNESSIDKGEEKSKSGIEEKRREEETEDEYEYVNKDTGEVGGPRGPEPTRFGDWEKNGRCSDF